MARERAMREGGEPQQTDSNPVLKIVTVSVFLIPILAFPSNQNMQNVAIKGIQLMAALLLGMLVLNGRLAWKRSSLLTFLGTGANLAVLLFALSAILSLLPIYHNPDMLRLGVVKLQNILAGVLLYFALGYRLRRSSELLRLAESLAGIAAILSVLGLSLVATQAYTIRAKAFGDAQLFGAFLMILFPVPLMLAITQNDPRRKIVAQVSAVLVVIGLLTAGTRSTWIGALVILLALAGFSRVGARRDRPMSRAQVVIPVLTILICALFAAFQGDVVELVQRRIDSGDDTFRMRQQTHWYAASQLIKVNPMLGVGLGAYPVYQFSYSTAGRPGSVVLENHHATLSEMAHSTWLQTATEQGLLGAALLAGILLSFEVAGWQRLRVLRSGVRRTLLLTSMAGVLGFAVDGLTNPGWEFAQISLFFWLLLGLGLACLRPRPA